MCTRFVYRGSDPITGFNFDIDLAVWDHKIIAEKDLFFIGILRPDGKRHAYHGVNRNGNIGTLLYVHGNPNGAYREGENCLTIADLTEHIGNQTEILCFSDFCFNSLWQGVTVLMRQHPADFLIHFDAVSFFSFFRPNRNAFRPFGR